MDVKFLRGLYSNYSVLANAGTANADAFYITGPSDGVYDSIYLGSHLLGSSLASEIKLTGFDLGEGKSSSAGISTSDTVLSAIQKLDLTLNKAIGGETAVISFGGKVGAITLSDAGNVTLTMVDNALKADVDLTHNHDDVYQKALTAGDLIEIAEIEDVLTISVVTSDFVAGDDGKLVRGLVTNETVKSFVENYVSTIVSDYVTTVSLTQTLGNYVTNNALGERLSGYVTSKSLTETLKGYATADQGALADTAIQSVTTGTANGTISVDGEDVAVKGLGSAAFTDSSVYQPAGNYQEALTTDDYINIDENNKISTVQGSFATAEAEMVEGLATVGAVETYVEAQIETITNVLTWGSF